MKTFKAISGSELVDKNLGDIPFVVNGLLPTGLSLLAGSAKIGKSWFALWLSVQIAKGEPIWDYEVTKGTALYLCYEDNEIRIQSRLLEITDEVPDNVYFCMEISRLGGELESRIQNFMIEQPDTKLIIIDTLQTVRIPGTESSYSNDYSDLMILKKLADDYQIAILLIHHFRKQKDGDVFQQITGSTGLQGAVDTMFTLSQAQRGENTAVFNCVGRDIEPRELELERNEDNVWVKVADSLSEGNLKDKRFLDAVSVFMAERESFSGNATELATHLSSVGDETFSNKIISKNIKKLARKLEQRGILSNIYRTGKARMVELLRANEPSSEGADTNVEIDTAISANDKNDVNDVDDSSSRVSETLSQSSQLSQGA